MLQKLSTWLMDQGVRDTPVREFVIGFCERLRDGGVPIERFSFGGMILHPVFGANQIVWQVGEGIALHAGRAAYANIGTPRRLEFSVLGTAANEVARMEGLCKGLGTCVLTSHAFKEICASELVALGRHRAAGVSEGLEVYTLPELTEPTLRPRS